MMDQASQLRGMIEEIRNGTVGADGFSCASSVPAGVVSYAPKTHHDAMSNRRSDRPLPQSRVRLANAITICSGKGGVGKSNVAVNLAVVLSRLGNKVCLLDADLGMANADVLCNLSPRRTLEHVVNGQCELAEVALLAPGGFRLIPGGSGVVRLANMPQARRLALLRQLSIIDRTADYIIIDTSAGLNANVLGFAASANRVLMITTPEPTSVTDAYGMIKVLWRQFPEIRIEIVVNMVESEAEGREVFARINRVCRTFLLIAPRWGGCLPIDHQVPEAVRMRVPFTLYSPDGGATKALKNIANRLAGNELEPLRSSSGFFSRLMSRFSTDTSQSRSN